MKHFTFVVGLTIALGIAAPILPPRSASGAETDSVVLSVRGDVDQPLQLTLADLGKMPAMTVKAREKNGDEGAFAGVALFAVIKQAKPRLTEKCCGNTANTCVVVRAADGYRAVFSLAEIDPDFAEAKFVLALRRDGKALSESQGPIRLIVPGEKVHSRWVRQVTSLEVVRLAPDDKPPEKK